MRLLVPPVAAEERVAVQNVRVTLTKPEALGGGAVLRNFYGHTADGMSTPRAVWHPRRQFVLGNSQKDCDAHVWCVASERTRTRLQGHRRAVRDLAHHPAANLLFSVSYDKTLRVWKTGDEGDGEEQEADAAVSPAAPAVPAAKAPAPGGSS